MAKANSNKQATQQATQQATPASTLATLQAASAPVTATPGAPVKRAPVAIVAGMVNGAAPNAPLFINLGQPLTATQGGLVPHVANQQGVGNTNRLPIGSVTITAKGALLKPTGSTPAQAAWAQGNWAAIQAAIASGPQTAAQLAALIGNGGAAHIRHRINGGHLAVTK